jgi:L-asparaginase
MAMNSRKKIVILGTGGTIAGKANDETDNIGYKAGQVGVNELLAAIPGLNDGPCDVLAEQVTQLDSKDMSFAVWQKLARRVQALLVAPEVQGIVITHGTDTLEETAYFLQALLNPDKPVVLTCAMRPASSTAPDGPQNMMDAVSVASLAGARGVVAVCAGTIHSAVDVQKTHTYRVDAFGSGDAGAVGYVEEGVVRLMRNWPSTPVNTARGAIEKIASALVWPRVEIVMNYAGASGAIVTALMDQGRIGAGEVPPVLGLVVAATGNGSVHEDMEAALLGAQAQGVSVVRASRCPMGRVLSVPDAAIADSGGLSPVKARIALMLALMLKQA